MSIFGNKDKSENVVCNFAHVDGIDGLPKDAHLVVTTDDENKRIAFTAKFSKRQVALLSYSQICGIELLTEKEIIDQSKSVVGRAAVGGVLLGPLGAIVGGMSGVGDKKKSKTHYYVVINYHPSSNPEEINILSLEPNGITPWDKFVKKVKEKCNIQPVTSGGYL